MTSVVFPASELVPNTANGFIYSFFVRADMTGIKGYLHREGMSLYLRRRPE